MDSVGPPCTTYAFRPTKRTARRAKDNATIVVTHYQRLLNYIIPDFVHVLVDGQVMRSGGKELALELEEKGYDWVKETPENVTT